MINNEDKLYDITFIINEQKIMKNFIYFGVISYMFI